MASWSIWIVLLAVAIVLSDCALGFNAVEPDLNCDFSSKSKCGWKDESHKDGYKWEVQSEARLRHTGPDRGHTPGRDRRFLLMSSGYRKLRNESAFYVSELINTQNDVCLTFWYMMKGYTMGNLTVTRAGLEERQQLFLIIGAQGKRWYQATVNITKGTFMIEIAGSYNGTRGYGDIAIDDIEVSYSGPCAYDESERGRTQPRFDCNFQDDMCSWYPDKDDQLQWEQVEAPSSSDDRHVLNPLSNDTGYASLKRVKRGYYSETLLSSPTISVDAAEACLHFWFRKAGSLAEVLKVTRLNEWAGPYSTGSTLFQHSEDTGGIWTEIYLPIRQGDRFRIAFLTRSYSTSEGSMFIDDITLTRGGPCPTDDEHEEKRVSCDFESNFCHWYMTSPRSEGDWERIQGPTPSNDTGPPGDHTTGDGHYIYMDASRVEKGLLRSPKFDVSPVACFSFWYYMHGADVNDLELELGSFFQRGEHKLQGEQGDEWRQYNVTLSYDTALQLKLFARRGYFPRGDIAIDDISITFGNPCWDDRTTTPEVTTTTLNPNVNTAEEEHATTPTTTTTTTTEPPPLPIPTLVIKSKINPLKIYNNTKVELECQVDTLENRRVEWYKAVHFSEYSQKITSKWQTSSYVFEEIQPKDSGVYYCALSSYMQVEGMMSNPVELRVVSDPRPSPYLRLHGGYSDRPVMANIKARLECGDKVEGVEDYIWSRNKYGSTSILKERGRVLYMNDTSDHNDGLYWCRATKDGFVTAKSNMQNIVVKEGKSCGQDWECSGSAYRRDCVDHRCRCSSSAVLIGNGCRVRPKRPVIKTSPMFLEFGIGETFYLYCTTDEVLPPHAEFRVGRNYGGKRTEFGPVNILKIDRASIEDTGDYVCLVRYDGVESFSSQSIQVQIKEFVNLNCNFANDLCLWSQGNGSQVKPFQRVENIKDSYLQLDNSPGYDPPVRALLTSPHIDRTTLDSCLRFKYRMRGTGAYSLSVFRYQKTYDHEWLEGTKLWSVIGTQQWGWHEQKVTIPPGTKFQLTFEAIGTAAINDIVFKYREAC